MCLYPLHFFFLPSPTPLLFFRVLNLSPTCPNVRPFSLLRWCRLNLREHYLLSLMFLLILTVDLLFSSDANSFIEICLLTIITNKFLPPRHLKKTLSNTHCPPPHFSAVPWSDLVWCRLSDASMSTSTHNRRSRLGTNDHFFNTPLAFHISHLTSHLSPVSYLQIHYVLNIHTASLWIPILFFSCFFLLHDGPKVLQNK